MEVERYYYAVASFMRKDDKISVSSVTCSVRGEKKDIKFYPLMEIITDVEEKFGDDMVSGTVIIQSVIEISKQDYDAYNERIAKLHKKDGKVNKGNGKASEERSDPCCQQGMVRYDSCWREDRGVSGD